MEESLQELQRPPPKLGTFGDNSAACWDLCHNETKKAEKYPPIQIEALPKKILETLSSWENWGTSCSPQKEAQPNEWSEGWRPCDKSRDYPKRSGRKENTDRTGEIIKSLWPIWNTLRKSQRHWNRKGPWRTDCIPLAIFEIEHGWETRASKISKVLRYTL